MHECYNELDSPEKRYLERPDAAQKNKRAILILTDEKDLKIETFEQTYRKIVAKLPLKGCNYASMDIDEDELDVVISEFLGTSRIHHDQSKSERKINLQDSTLKERVELFIRDNYGKGWFSSNDLKRDFEKEYGTLGLSTASTYLARMDKENILEHRGNRNNREYKIKTKVESP